MKRIKKKWIIIGIIIFIIIGYFIVANFLKKPLDNFITEKAIRGQVLQEISETGSIKATESVSMGFKTMGKIAKINVTVGDNVKKGNILAELDLNQSSAQLQSAEATLRASQQQYEKLLNGLTEGDIKVYQDDVVASKYDLQAAYDSSLNTLNDAYTKIYNAYTAAVSVRNSSFSAIDQNSTRVSDSVNSINSNMQDIKTYLVGDIDNAITHMIIVLGNISNDLKIIRDQCDEGIYYSKVSSTDKTTLDAQKGYINTASASVTSSQKSINLYKIALRESQDILILKTTKPRAEDINISQSQIDQAKANIYLYQSQISDAYLRSPINGKITNVNAKRGEVASPSEPIINLLSSDPFQIRANIYEQDIVNVKLGDLVLINLVAFPKQTFEGKIIAIEPAEKIIDNVVYYEVAIDFLNQPNAIKSGMTADIVIITNDKNNVLRVSKNAVENINGKDMLQVITKGKVESRQVTIGLEGNNYVEVLAGLNEGEDVVIGKK
jgi:HlyD family secretion protein